jgi:hypothetical protein
MVGGQGGGGKGKEKEKEKERERERGVGEGIAHNSRSVGPTPNQANGGLCRVEVVKKLRLPVADLSE